MLASPVTSGMFRLVRSMFGCGFILTGTHPAIAASENVLCDHAKELVNHASSCRSSLRQRRLGSVCLKLAGAAGSAQTVIFREKEWVVKMR